MNTTGLVENVIKTWMPKSFKASGEYKYMLWAVSGKASVVDCFRQNMCYVKQIMHFSTLMVIAGMKKIGNTYRNPLHYNLLSNQEQINCDALTGNHGWK